MIIDWCCHTTFHKIIKKFVGCAVFWVMLGPIAMAMGWLLWMSSVPKTVTAVWRTNAGNTHFENIARVTFATARCTIVAPFWLIVLWVKGGLTGTRRMITLLRNGGGRLYCRGGYRANTAGASRQASLQDLDHGATGNFGDESEDVVMVVLNKEEGGEGCTPATPVSHGSLATIFSIVSAPLYVHVRCPWRGVSAPTWFDVPSRAVLNATKSCYTETLRTYCGAMRLWLVLVLCNGKGGGDYSDGCAWGQTCTIS